MTSQPLFWIYLFFLFQIFIFLSNRISFHPMKGYDESLWTRYLTLVLMAPMAVMSWSFMRYWDFKPGTFSSLPPLLQLFAALIALWVLILWADHLSWHWFRKKVVTFRALKRERIKMPDSLQAPFGFLKSVGFENQIYQPQVVEYEVELPHWPREFSGLTVVQISDIHMGKYIGPDYVRAVVEKAKRLKPDLFALTGDFVAFTRDIPRLVGLLKGFKAPLGVYAVAGNHDRWADGDALDRGLKKDGIRVLVNEVVYRKRKGKVLAILGADDLWFGNRDEKRLLEACGDAKLFLAHHPDHFYLAKRTQSHLQLSGHCHGGQICFPLLGPLIVPANEGRKYTGGFVREGETTMYINHGAGCYPPLRTYCPPEIVKLTLKSAD